MKIRSEKIMELETRIERSSYAILISFLEILATETVKKEGERDEHTLAYDIEGNPEDGNKDRKVTSYYSQACKKY